MSQTLTLEVPNGLYVHIKKRAEQANRSVEDELLEVLAATVLAPDQADLEHQQTISSLEPLDNSALERAARSHLLAEFAAELEALHLKQQREPLTDAESKRCVELVRANERSMLIRAHAAALVKKAVSMSPIWSPSPEPDLRFERIARSRRGPRAVSMRLLPHGPSNHRQPA